MQKQAASLERLPIELQTQIITYLKDIDPRSLLALARVSKSLYYQCIDHIYYEVTLKHSNRIWFFWGLNSGIYLQGRRDIKPWYNNQPQQLLFGQSTTLRRLLLLDKVHRVIIADGLALEKILDIANDVAMEHYFISPPSYIETKTQPLFRNLGQGKKGLPCMIWEEDAMEQFESWIELSYLDDWQYAEEHDECSSERDTSLARERLENLYDLHLFDPGTPLCIHLPADSVCHESQRHIEGVFKGHTPKILALHNVKLEDWRFGISSRQYTPDEMHLFLLAQGLPENTYERPLAHRDALGRPLS